MEECTQITIAEWQQWKQEIKDRLNQTVENFIAIGYRLRRIQDTEAYRNDGHATVYEFAQKEYGLSDSTTNRFMAINAKFTVEGNGTELLPEFAGISYSKLQEMLTLSDEDCRLITVHTTVREIRDLKNFNHDNEAKYIPPAGQQASRTPLRECIWDFFASPGNRMLLEDTMAALTAPDYGAAVAAVIADNISPSGSRTHRKGIVYLFMYDYDRGVAYKLMTSPLPVKLTWESYLEEVRATYAEYTGVEGSIWEAAYGSRTEPEQETQIPGQMDITQLQDEDTKEPENPTKSEAGKNTDFATSQEPKNITAQTEIVQDADKSPVFRPVSMDSHAAQGEKETDQEGMEKDEAGKTFGHDTVPAEGTGGTTDAGEPGENAGASAGTERTEGEQLQEPDESHGVSDSGECEDNPVEGIMAEEIPAEGMTEEKWKSLWKDMADRINELDIFANVTYESQELVNSEIDREEMEDRYKDAVAVAAALERMLNGKKYHAE